MLLGQQRPAEHCGSATARMIKECPFRARADIAPARSWHALIGSDFRLRPMAVPAISLHRRCRTCHVPSALPEELVEETP